MSNPNKETFISSVAAGLTIAMLIGVLTFYNDVQANSAYRLDGAKKDKLLVEIHERLIRMEQDQKYLLKDVDQVKLIQKEVANELQVDRDKIAKPWLQQTSRD